MKFLDKHRQSYVNFLVPHFKNNDFAVTLTYPEYHSQHSRNYIPNYIKASSDMRHLLNVINYKIYGRKYKTGKAFLRNAHAFEHSAYHGLHVHMVIENPIKWCIPESSKTSLILDSWAGMRCHGYYDANKVKHIYEIEGWIRYCFKNITYFNTECCDIYNWHLNTNN